MSNKTDVVIIGAGGHAKVVAATARDAGYKVVAFCDDDPAKAGTTVAGIPVISESDLNRLNKETIQAVVAIGDNNARTRVVKQYQDSVNWVTLVHPRANIDPSVRLGIGTVVFAGACIQPDTVIGDHCIINTGATVDHDCLISDFVHIGPGVNLAGGVKIGQGSLLGVGTAVIPGKSIGEWSIIGAGGAVVDDLPGHVTAAGVPARVIKAL